MRALLVLLLAAGLALGCGTRPGPSPTPDWPTPAPIEVLPTDTPPAPATATPTPAPTATPQPTPTATLEAATGVSLRFGVDITADGALVNQGQRFAAGTELVVARIDFEALSAQDSLSYELFRGEEQILASGALTGADFGAPSEASYRWIWVGLPSAGGYKAGLYRLVLQLNGQTATSGQFEVSD